MENMFKKMFKSYYMARPEIFYYRGYKYHRFNLPFLLKLFVQIFQGKLNLPYYMVFHDYLILSENQTLLKHLIDSYRTEKTLARSDTTFSYIEGHGLKANIYGYWNNSLKTLNLLRGKDLYKRMVSGYSKGILAIRMANGGLEENLFLLHPKDKVRLLPKWPLAFNGKIISAPQIRNIDASVKDKMVIGTKNKTITVADIYGKVSYGWPLKTPSPMIHYPQVLSFPKRNFIVAFFPSAFQIYTTKGKLHKQIDILSRIGSSLPVLADMNRDGFTDIVFTDKDGYIHSLDIKKMGETPFFPIQADPGINSLIITNLNNEKSIIASTMKGFYYISVEKQSCFFIPVNNINPISPLSLDRSKNLYILTRRGDMIQVNPSGRVNKKYKVKLKGPFLNHSVVGTILGKEESIMAINTRGFYYLLNKEGKILANKKLRIRPIPYVDIKLLDVDHDGFQEILIPARDNYIYIIKANGKVLSRITGRGSFSFSDINKNGLVEIATVLNNHLYLYEIPYITEYDHEKN